MRLLGLSNEALQRLQKFSKKSVNKQSSSENENSAQDSTPESTGVSLEEEIQDITDREITLTVLEEEESVALGDGKKDLIEESEEILEDDTSEEQVTGDLPSEPWDDSWKITSLKKCSYDIRNYYEEDAEGSIYGPVAINIDLNPSQLGLPVEDDRLVANIENHIQHYIQAVMDFGNEHHIAVQVNTLPEESSNEVVDVDLSGINPEKKNELRTLVTGLVQEAIDTYGGQ